MQQGMMAMFGMITQLYTHTGLVPQQPGQPGLQGVGAPQLAVTPAPAPTAALATTVTPETAFSMSALLGSAGRPLFSPLPATTLFQDSPSAVQSVALPVVPQTLPSGGGGGEGSLLQQSTQPVASALTSALIAPVQPILHQVLCSNERLPNAPKHYETDQNKSLGSN